MNDTKKKTLILSNPSEDDELFAQYRRLFFHQLKEHDKRLYKAEEKITALKIEQAVLKAKAGLIGTIAGGAISIAVSFLTKYLLG